MTLVKERKREREGREKLRCNDTVMIQRLRLTFVFKKMVNVATNGAFFPRASLLNTIVQQVESPARESMDTSVVDVIATCKCVRFYNVFLRGEKKTLLGSIMQTIEQASPINFVHRPFHTHGQVNFYLIRSSDHRSTIG